MNIRGRYFALLLIAAMLVGGAASYIGIQLAQPGQPVPQTEDGLNDSEADEELKQQQKEMLEQFQNMGELGKISQSLSIIKENYVEKVNEKELIEGAIQGMLSTLEDPYSVFMDKETMEQFTDTIESSFEGIGAEVSMVEGKVTIVSPFKDSPAEIAGLKPNDQILKVDGESISGLDLYEAVLKIRGEKGTTVRLTVQRPGVSDLLKIDVVRDDIPIETIYSSTETLEGKKAGIIEITSFSEKTAADFETALLNLEKEENIEGLIIDVRGNPGGLFTSVEGILQNFITDEHPYVQIEDRNGEKSTYHTELKEPKGYPIVILIDEGSASASEILAATMDEAGGYELVGAKTFGKGTVQQPFSLGDGSTIKLTLFKWLTPEGNWVHKEGIMPTIEQKQPDYFYTNPIVFTDDKPYTYDMTGEQIENIQIMLQGIGYSPERADGYFSQETVNAVKQFQANQGIAVTGIVDEETAGKLEEKVIEAIRNEENDIQLEKALEVLFQ